MVLGALAKVAPCKGGGSGVASPFTERGTLVSAQQVDESWQLRASCRGPQSTVFFPPASFERKDEKLERESRAKEICRTCPVKTPCLDYAIQIKEPHGIWGGLNEAERKQFVAPGAH